MSALGGETPPVISVGGSIRANPVSHVGHYGTGDLELTVSTLQQVEAVQPLIEMAYQQIWG